MSRRLSRGISTRIVQFAANTVIPPQPSPLPFAPQPSPTEEMIAYPNNPSSGSYDHTYWSKAFKSQLREFDYVIDEVEGEVPKTLKGTLFRSFPGRFERGGVEYGHYLDGDGAIAKFEFKDGVVRFQSSFVKTKEFIDETLANKVLFRSVFKTQRPANILFNTICINNAFDFHIKNVANTNILYWGKRLLTFFEAGIPYCINPSTLETIGIFDMGINLKSGIPVNVEGADWFNTNIAGSYLSAHPKIDSVKNRLLSFETLGYKKKDSSINVPMLRFHEWDTNLKPMNKIEYFLNNTLSGPHDFSITDKYYIVIENRMQGDTTPYLLGKVTAAACMNINSNVLMNLHVISRSNGSSIIIPLCVGFTIHSVSAFEQNGKLLVYTTAWKSETIAEGGIQGGLLGAWAGTAPVFKDIPLTLLYRTEVDLATNKLVSHAPVSGLEDTVIEHPHIHPSYEGKPVKAMYMSLGSSEGVSSPPLGYLRLDISSGNIQKWYAPLHTYCEEVVIVPKTEDGDEEDVWMLAMMFDGMRDRSCLGVFDGKNISDGPVARLWLKHHLPHSLHGHFASEIF